MTKPADQLSHRELALEIEKGCKHFWSKRGGDPFGFKWTNPMNPYQNKQYNIMKPLCPTCNGRGYQEDTGICPECVQDGFNTPPEEYGHKHHPKTSQEVLAGYKRTSIRRQKLKRTSLY